MGGRAGSIDRFGVDEVEGVMILATGFCTVTRGAMVGVLSTSGSSLGELWLLLGTLSTGDSVIIVTGVTAGVTTGAKVRGTDGVDGGGGGRGAAGVRRNGLVVQLLIEDSMFVPESMLLPNLELKLPQLN
jgi:hypothetical protein